METQWENQTRRNQTLLSPTSLLTYSEFLSEFTFSTEPTATQLSYNQISGKYIFAHKPV